MLNVNDVRRSVQKLGSLTASVSTGSVYNGALNRYARKRELNIIVTASDNKRLMIRQVPLFDSMDLDLLRADANTNKYLHIGCVTMSIEPLMHQRYLKDYGPNIRGYCMLVDASFKKLEESIISAYQYDLRNGRADYVSFPNHCLSISDPHIQKRLSVLVGFDHIDVEPGAELFNLCIGYIITGVNTLNPTGSKGIVSFPISGAKEMDVSALLDNGNDDFHKAYNRAELVTNPSDDDIYIKSKGSFLSNIYGSTKTIKRRTMRVRMEHELEGGKVGSSQAINQTLGGTIHASIKKQPSISAADSDTPDISHRRSTSERISEEELYKILNSRAVLTRVGSMPRRLNNK
nr:TPA_asm: P3 [Morinda alphacytorhabdovirus 1_Mor]